MATGDDGRNEEAGGGIPSAFDAFLTELDASAPKDADRINKVHENVAEGNVDADPTWFAPYLTEKQVRYGLAYVENGGDFKKARAKAGYKNTVKQDEIETGPAMRAYMVAIKATVARSAMMSGKLIIERLNRLALTAEERGQIDSAIRANVKLGEAQGMFVKAAPTINVNGEGTVINIGAARSSDEDDNEAIDAVFEEIAADNGIKALPKDGGN